MIITEQKATRKLLCVLNENRAKIATSCETGSNISPKFETRLYFLARKPS